MDFANTRGNNPSGLLFMNSRECDHRPKDIKLTRQSLKRARKTREKAK